jgi:hypothetical protein
VRRGGLDDARKSRLVAIWQRRGRGREGQPHLTRIWRCRGPSGHSQPGEIASASIQRRDGTLQIAPRDDPGHEYVGIARLFLAHRSV